MDVESVSSETNLVIITKIDRAKLFCKFYWQIIIFILTPLLLLPIAFLGRNNAYKCFYIFLITTIYWIIDVLHPSIVALVPIALSTVMGSVNKDFITEIYLRNGLLDCLGMMMIIVAIEHSLIHRRIALKLMLIFGCSHYRLSFLLFFWCMFLSIWVPNTMACGLMMPIVKAVLEELEKMGILEIYQTVGKNRIKSNRHEQIIPSPTDFTIFYFLGIAYSSSVGGMATLIGSQTNQIFKSYCEKIFPYGPEIEFPHFMLLNLPGVILLETLLYLWMNFYYLGMFRAQSEIALEVGISEEEAQYIKTLLTTQYQQLGKLTFHQGAISAVVIFLIILQTTTSTAQSHTNISSPTIVCVVLLFIIPVNLDFVKYFTTLSDDTPPPNTPRRACLNWNLVRNTIHWNVLFITGGSCTIFDSLKRSGMTHEFEKFLLLFQHWPAPTISFIVILFCKIFTEFTSNSCVAHTLLPNIARLSVTSKVNPHYLMLAATLACSLPFHLPTGTPSNAMVQSYVYIPPWKMMHAGFGPGIISIVVVWFTVTLWSKAVWSDINLYSSWAKMHTLNSINVTLFK